jgi:hypothetical protein
MTLFRIMLKDTSGKPLCGAAANMLGARVGVDVRPTAQGDVHPGCGGLSVVPEDPARFPPHLRPLRFGGQCGLPLFRIASASIVVPLAYAPDPRKPQRHGTIEPAAAMPLAHYQSALADTVHLWEETP